MSTNNICFSEENQKKYCVSIIKYALMKFSADLSLSVPVLAGFFTYYKFFLVILKKDLNAQCGI